MKENKENLPAINDIEMRELNTKKVIDTVEKAGDYLEVAKKTQKATKIYLLIIIGFFILMIAGSYCYMYFKTDGEFLDNIFNTYGTTHRFDCYGNGYNTTFTQPESALQFKELFSNVTCEYRSTRKK